MVDNTCLNTKKQIDNNKSINSYKTEQEQEQTNNTKIYTQITQFSDN